MRHGEIIDVIGADLIVPSRGVERLGIHNESIDLARLLGSSTATVNALRLLDLLPEHPVMTFALAIDLLDVAKPPAAKCIDDLVAAGVLRETTRVTERRR